MGDLHHHSPHPFSLPCHVHVPSPFHLLLLGSSPFHFWVLISRQSCYFFILLSGHYYHESPGSTIYFLPAIMLKFSHNCPLLRPISIQIVVYTFFLWQIQVLYNQAEKPGQEVLVTFVRPVECYLHDIGQVHYSYRYIETFGGLVPF